MIICYRCKNYFSKYNHCLLDDSYIELTDRPFCERYVPEVEENLLDFMR